MKTIKIAFVLVFVLSFAALARAAAQDGPSYVMRGTSTDLWGADVDYDALPIQLHRIKDTFPLHEIDFEILRYKSECAQWETVCVAHDPHGNCTAYEQRCVQWTYETTPVPKKIELDFRGLPALAQGDDETYELQITRVQPAGDGEDWVTTSFRDVKTKQPVKIIPWSDYHYEIDPK